MYTVHGPDISNFNLRGPEAFMWDLPALLACSRVRVEPLIFSTSEKRRSRFAADFPANPPRCFAAPCMEARKAVSTSGPRRAISVDFLSRFDLGC